MLKQYTPTERFEELDRIDLDDAFGVMDVYCRTLLPDKEASLALLQCILRKPKAETHPLTREWIAKLVRKATALGPLDPQPLGLARNLTGDPDISARLKRLEQFDEQPSRAEMRSVVFDNDCLERRRHRLLQTLERKPGHVPAAAMLLQLDFYQGIENGPWLDAFTVPQFFRDAWTRRRFIHLASLGAADQALALWRELADRPVNEVECYLAAAQFALTGDDESAIHCFRQALDLDPDQLPLRLRMAELEHPSKADPTLTERHDVAICIYSWNKADDLEATLRDWLPPTSAGAKIRVLLNGCTDRSPAVAEAGRGLFPDNAYEVITLPINVGAPAARNWLGALPEVRASQFVAYLDDDVDLPADWLAHFLTVMERFPNTAAVGCKIVHSFDHRRIQYLHRRFTLAVPGMLKLTEPCQIGQMDCGLYDYVCETETVMGCCHLLRMAHLPDGPQFDLRYSPSQVDDIAHDLELRLAGHEVRYCGLVRCVHRQNTGGALVKRPAAAQLGQVLGNDTKFYFAFHDRLERIREIMRETHP